MVNELSREAILELMPCDCGDCGRDDHAPECPRAFADYLLEELAKPREERRDYLGRRLVS